MCQTLLWFGEKASRQGGANCRVLDSFPVSADAILAAQLDILHDRLRNSLKWSTQDYLITKWSYLYLHIVNLSFTILRTSLYLMMRLLVPIRQHRSKTNFVKKIPLLMQQQSQNHLLAVSFETLPILSF